MKGIKIAWQRVEERERGGGKKREGKGGGERGEGEKKDASLKRWRGGRGG